MSTQEVRSSSGRPFCVIHLGDIENPCALPCAHVFCEECIAPWWRTSQSCPTCNTNHADAEEPHFEPAIAHQPNDETGADPRSETSDHDEDDRMQEDAAFSDEIATIRRRIETWEAHVVYIEHMISDGYGDQDTFKMFFEQARAHIVQLDEQIAQLYAAEEDQ